MDFGSFDDNKDGKLNEELEAINGISDSIRNSLDYAKKLSFSDVDDDELEPEEDFNSEAEEVSLRAIELEEARADRQNNVYSEGEESQKDVYESQKDGYSLVEREMRIAEMPEGEEDEEEEGEDLEEGEEGESEDELSDYYEDEYYWIVEDGHVDDEYERKQDELVKKRKEKAHEMKASGHKPNKKRYMNDSENDSQDDTIGAEVEIELPENEYRDRIELRMDKEFPLNQKHLVTYKSFYIFYTMSALFGDYKQQLTDKMNANAKELKEFNSRYVALVKQNEDCPTDEFIKGRLKFVGTKIRDTSAKLDNFKFQLDCERIIKDISERVIAIVIVWLRRFDTTAQITLNSILLRNNKEEEITYMSFQKIQSHIFTCSIGNKPIKAGQSWVATMWRGDGKKEECVIDFHWVQFLSYWQCILKQTDIIKENAKKGLLDKAVNGKVPDEMLATHINDMPTIESCMRLLVISFAWFYKELDGTPEGSKFLETIESDWYTVCGYSRK